MLTLRPYQTECLEAITQAHREGKNRLLVSLPTGTGKTVVFAHLPRCLSLSRKMLVLAHREELLEQAAEKIRAANPGARVEIEQSERRADPGAYVIVASVPSIGREGSQRIARFEPSDFGLIICDEAHHAIAPSYRNIFDHFGLPENKEVLLVGFTATPRRGDGVGLEEVFDEIVFHRDIKEMIQAGYLSPITGYRVHTQTDLSKVHSRMGDFVQEELSEAINNASRNARVVKSYLDRVPGRKAIVFAVNVQHACDLAGLFQEVSIPCAAVTGEMDREVRRKILEDFREGSIRVLTNCMVLSEGFDQPDIEAVILARPTQSGTLYCLDLETEVLTARGWLRHDEVSMEDRAAGFIPKTGEILWTDILGKVVRPLSVGEEMYEYRSPSIDIRVTGNHRMLYRSTERRASDAYSFIEAKDLAQKRTEFKIPVSGIEKIPGVPLSDDELRFIGWFLTDGCRNKRNNAIAITQAEHQPYNEDIVSCLQGCGFKYGVYRSSSKSQFKRTSPMLTYTISKGRPRGRDKYLRGWEALEPYIMDKDIAPVLEDMSPRQLGIMLEAMHLANGSKQLGQQWTRRSYHIFTGSKALADKLQSLCVRKRFRCNIARPRNTRLYTLHIKPGTYRHVGGNGYDDRPTFQLSKSIPGEMVWCIETTTGTLVTRRNGKVAIMGNSQMIGRGTRLAPGKECLTVIDIVDNSRRHSLMSLATLFGLPANLDLKGRDVLEADREIEKACEKHPGLNLDRVTDLETLRLRVEEFDFFAEVALPQEVERYSRLTWFRMPDGSYRISLGKGEQAAIQQNLLGQYEITVLGERLQALPKELWAAFGHADRAIGRRKPEALPFLLKNARWRREDRATEKQLETLRKLGIAFPPNISKGEASLRIGKFFAARSAR